MLTESRNHGMTEPRNHGTTEGQGESSIAPLFQSGAIKISLSHLLGWLHITAHFGCPLFLVEVPYQRTIGPEKAHLKPDLAAFSHHEMTLTLNTHIPLLTS